MTLGELATLATALIVALLAWSARRQVQKVHVLVNSRMSDMEKRVRQLTAALEGSDTRVPPAPEREGI